MNDVADKSWFARAGEKKSDVEKFYSFIAWFVPRLMIVLVLGGALWRLDDVILVGSQVVDQVIDAVMTPTTLELFLDHYEY